MKEGLVIDTGFVNNKDHTHLTVMKTSLFFAGDGFTVYDCKGQLVFRVDSYGPDTRDRDELVLMDAHGKCLLTVRRKVRNLLILFTLLYTLFSELELSNPASNITGVKPSELRTLKFVWSVNKQRPSLRQRWEGFLGERLDGQKPIFSVRRSSLIGGASMRVEVYDNPGDQEYEIDGCFAQRSCFIRNARKEIVGEIRRKVDVSTNMVLGKDVLSLCIKPGFDGAFAMGLVLVLDQINGYEVYDDGVEMDSTVRD